MGRVELKFTITGYYTADPRDYETFDPVEMARIDQQNFEDGGVSLADVCDWTDEAWLTIEPRTDSGAGNATDSGDVA